MKGSPRTMLARVKAYLSQRRALGYRLCAEGTSLLSFAHYADQCGHRGPPRNVLMLRWARRTRRPSRPTWARRLNIVRLFAKHCQGLERGAEVPPRFAFGSRPPRPTPYLYSGQQIQELLHRAHQLPDARQAQTYVVLLGLLACTGLRISEALGLRVADVDLAGGVLCIRESKYHKLRWVPLHPTTVRRLRTYLRARRRWPSSTQHLFVAKQGHPLTRTKAQKVFRQLRRGLADPAQPRLHDLRHRFAVCVLMRWQAQKQGVANRLPILACYLGHNRVAHTYWYLQAFPSLLAQAARAFRPIAK